MKAITEAGEEGGTVKTTKLDTKKAGSILKRLEKLEKG